jgi:CIC family chloride channel protein
VKFVGGLLAIGGGLALGREGPSVQMGANIGMFLGKKLRLSQSDCMALMAACGGAGIATAFNAPIAGSVFVLEELVRRFDTKIAIAALGSSCCAIAVARLFLGRTPDFQVGSLSFSDVGSGFLFLTLGAVAGFLGIAYNRTLLGTISLVDSIRWASSENAQDGRGIKRPAERASVFLSSLAARSRALCALELRAAVIGAIVGAVAWFAPDMVGGGDALTQRMLSPGEGARTIAWVFLLRFLLGPLSYAAGTPGGLFAPMLVLGAQLGLLFSAFAAFAFPHIVVAPTAFTVVAMAAFFTAVVRAPVTGIILVIELTANFTQLMPMLWACFAAMVVPTLFGNRPIYESLSKPAVQEERGGE